MEQIMCAVIYTQQIHEKKKRILLQRTAILFRSYNSGAVKRDWEKGRRWTREGEQGKKRKLMNMRRWRW